MNFLKADYNGNSILNLMATLENSMGGKSRYKPLANFDNNQIKNSRNIVLIVLDGMGFDFLTKYGQDSFLKQNIKRKVTSVFNPATTSTIPTIMTATPPEEHEMTGWYTFIKEIGTIIIPLMFVPRVNKESLRKYVDIKKIFNINPLANRINRKSYVINPSVFYHSAFSIASAGKAKLIGYNQNNVRDFFKKIKSAINKEGKKYVYAYYLNPDSLIHQFGSSHKKTLSNFKKVDKEIRKLTEGAKDTIFMITADHGLYDVEKSNRIEVPQLPEFREFLTMPLCGEGRLGFAYIKPSKRKKFERYCRKKLDKYLVAYKNTDFAREFCLPYGKRFLDRIGDYVLVVKEPYKINDYLINSEDSKNIGTHGGLSSREMFVPLIIIKR